MKITKKQLTELAGPAETRRVSTKLNSILKTRIQLLDGSIKIIEKVEKGYLLANRS